MNREKIWQHCDSPFQGIVKIMKQITLNLDDETFDSAETQAKQVGTSLPSLMLGFLRQFTAARDSEFDRLEKQEAVLHQRLRERGAVFSASDRLTRDELMVYGAPTTRRL